MIGPAGERGERGLEGPPGKLPIVKQWEPGKVYYAGDVIACDGGTFQASTDTGTKPTTAGADWTPLARAGRDAPTPVVRGTWSEMITDYRSLDIVAFNGGSFIARKDNPGPCPGDGWQLIASAGKRGPAGERGAPGSSGGKGEKGERGEKGMDAPRIVSWRMDRKTYRAIAKMSDGSEMEVSFRELFDQFHSETR